MKHFCPICRWTPTAEDKLCPTHGLYALPEAVLAKLPTAPLLGHVLNGRYALVGFIGGGGMGAVYVGLDIRLGREVAIKVLKQAISPDPSDRKRFEVEARALSKLRSANTVTIHDFGVMEQGVATPLAFMVMERVEGKDLGARIGQGPIEPTVVVDIVRQMGLSLDEAHGLAIIHRDIKPGNVLLTQTPAGELQVKMVDFGIARMDGESATATGSIMGTPQYMAPEQCVAAAVLDGRVDVYQTAVMTYEMLTGRRPFVAQNTIKILSMHIENAPPPLAGPEAAPVWRRLEAVVHRGMAKAAADRYPTVGAFGRALAEAFATDEPVAPLPKTKILAPVESVPPPRRSPWRWVAAVFALIGLASAAYLMGQKSDGSTPPLDAEMGAMTERAAPAAAPVRDAAPPAVVAAPPAVVAAPPVASGVSGPVEDDGGVGTGSDGQAASAPERAAAPPAVVAAPPAVVAAPPAVVAPPPAVVAAPPVASGASGPVEGDGGVGTAPDGQAASARQDSGPRIEQANKPRCGDRKCQRSRRENCRTCPSDCRCRKNFTCPKKGRLNPENRGCVPDLSNLGF